MDFILNIIITKHKDISHKEKIRKLPFDLKITILYELNLIEQRTYQDLKHLTKIRNNFAHSVTFEEQDIEIPKFTRFRNITRNQSYNSMQLNKGFKLVLLKFQLILTIVEIFYLHDFLYLENEPKK
jgi:DNA-binding MltR family transcriptional regulator